MPDIPTGSDSVSQFAEIQIFSKFVSDAVTNSVVAHLDSFYLKVFAGVISVMASAIAYMYLTQKTERKETDKRLYAVLKECASLMESVRGGLKVSESREKKTNKVLHKVNTILLGCVNRDTTLDNTPIANDDNNNDDDDE